MRGGSACAPSRRPASLRYLDNGFVTGDVHLGVDAELPVALLDDDLAEAIEGCEAVVVIFVTHGGILNREAGPADRPFHLEHMVVHRLDHLHESHGRARARRAAMAHTPRVSESLRAAAGRSSLAASSGGGSLPSAWHEPSHLCARHAHVRAHLSEDPPVEAHSIDCDHSVSHHEPVPLRGGTRRGRVGTDVQNVVACIQINANSPGIGITPSDAHLRQSTGQPRQSESPPRGMQLPRVLKGGSKVMPGGTLMISGAALGAVAPKPKTILGGSAWQPATSLPSRDGPRPHTQQARPSLYYSVTTLYLEAAYNTSP